MRTSSLTQVIYKSRWHILLLMFLLNVYFGWPGKLLADSSAQYLQAISGKYSDHHPPMMSFAWHYLDLLYTGPGLMFVLQLSMLYAAILILLLILDKFMPVKKRPLLCLTLLIVPIYPQVAIYSNLIVKDVQFAFSFLLAASVLAYYTARNKRPAIYVIIPLLLLMVYGAAVKYQGQFCVIILALWLGSLLLLNAKLWQKLITGILLYGLILFAICSFNNVLVPIKSKSYSWQFVKLYDLAAISIAADTDLIPAFNKTNAYSWSKLTSRFKYPTVDPYIYTDDNILQMTTDPQQMQILKHAWWHAVWQYPYLYLKHRTINISYALLSRPGFQDVVQILDKMPHDDLILPLVNTAVGLLFYIFMSHLPVIILGMAYTIFALVTWRKSKAAPILLGLTSTALLMVGILFFKSMAGVPRYTYIAIVLIHAAHMFAYKCWYDSRHRRS